MQAGKSLLVLAAVLLAGCDQIKELVAPPPAPEVNRLKELTVPVAVPKAPPPPSSDELVAAFKAARPEHRNDPLVVGLCSYPDAPPQFRELTFANSKLTDVGGKQLDKFQNLQSLILARTTISNGTLQAVATIDSLEQLDLSGTQITDAGLTALLRLKNLRELRVDGANISDQAFAQLGQLPALEALSAAGCRPVSGHQFTSALLQGAFPRLRILNVSGTPFGSGGLSRIGALETLEHLNVTACDVRDEGAAGIGECKHLEILEAGQNNFATQGVAAIAKCRTLRELGIETNLSIKDECFNYLKNLRDLEKLDVRRTACTEQGVRRLKTFLSRAVIQADGKTF